MASRGDVTEASSTAAAVRQSHMALAALALSVFAFIPPLGIAAVVLGHISSRDIAASQGKLNGKAIARAALIIGYVQMFLLTVAAVLIWLVLGLTLQDFRRDALVQRVLRESSANATLDYASAREEENTARALVIQMVAIEDQYYRGDRNYLCSVSGLSQVGVEGSTPAERRAFYERLEASAYIFELRGCDSEKSASHSSRLQAYGRAPRSTHAA